MSWAPLLLSFEVAVLATGLAGVLGVAVAGLMATVRFRGADLLDVLITAPLVLPPTVLGYYLLLLVGRSSAVGRAFEAVTGTSLVFTPLAAVLAATLAALPFVVRSARAAMEE
ncbi:MAG: molybdate ABC transporter permease subunit, partial [Myxococcales bacterium]